MAKANVLTLRIPGNLKHRIELMAQEQGVSINQLAMYMFTKEIVAMEAENEIASHWKHHSKDEIFQKFDEVMAKVKATPVPDWDELD